MLTSILKESDLNKSKHSHVIMPSLQMFSSKIFSYSSQEALILGLHLCVSIQESALLFYKEH